MNQLKHSGPGVGALDARYLKLAGGTLVGAVTLANLTNALNSGNYAVQMKSGVVDGATAVGFQFDTTNDLSVGTIGAKTFSIKNFGTEEFAIGQYNAGDSTLRGRGMYVPIHSSFGEGATPLANSIMNINGTVEGSANGMIFTVNLKPTEAFQSGAAFRMVANVLTGGVLPFYSGIVAKVNNSETVSWGATQGSLTPSVISGKYTTSVGSSNISYVETFQASRGVFSGGIPNLGIVGFAAEAQAGGTANINSTGFKAYNQGSKNAVGMEIQKQTGSTSGFGLWLNGNALGADIAFGTTPSANMYYNGTNLIINPKLAGSGALSVLGNISLLDYNVVLGTTTGTKFGTATAQKIGFWNATPIVQPTTAVAAATLVGGGGTTITDTDTFDGYTLKQVVKALRNTGLLA